MKKTLSLLGFAALIFADCKNSTTDLPGPSLYVDTRENPVIINNLSYNSVHTIRRTSDFHLVDEWFLTGIYDIQDNDSVLISHASMKSGFHTDTICGDWFGIVRNKHFMEVFISENNTGCSRKLRIQYASAGTVGQDLIIEQYK